MGPDVILQEFEGSRVLLRAEIANGAAAARDNLAGLAFLVDLAESTPLAKVLVGISLSAQTENSDG